MNFSAEDLNQLKRLGIDPARATRQINLLRTGQIDIKLERPCIVGDGIIQLQPAANARLQKAFEKAAAAGQVAAFCPGFRGRLAHVQSAPGRPQQRPGGPDRQQICWLFSTTWTSSPFMPTCRRPWPKTNKI